MYVLTVGSSFKLHNITKIRYKKVYLRPKYPIGLERFIE